MLHRSLITSRLFFFNHTPTTEIYTLSLHDALPIYLCQLGGLLGPSPVALPFGRQRQPGHHVCAGRDHALNGDFVSLDRSEEHTSELQSLRHLVCRLLLEKKKKCLTTK